MPIGADVSAQYTEEAVGGGHPTKARVIDRLALVEHHTDGKHKADRLPVGCGAYFEYSSATQVRLVKAAGSGLNIGHAFYGDAVPFLDGSGNLYYLRLNGIVTKDNADLAADMTYTAYAYDNNGAVAVELSTTGYTNAEIIPTKTGDKTRTLVGILRTNSSSYFVNTATQRWVASFWNRVLRTAAADITTGSTGNLIWTEMSQLTAVGFGGDQVTRAASGHQFNSMNNNASVVTISGASLSGTTVNCPSSIHNNDSAGQAAGFGLRQTDALGSTGMFSSFLYLRGVIGGTSSIGITRHEMAFWG